MSEKLSSSCPICNGYLFDDDDIVHCPVCGAPHHRDCWEAVGHCGLETAHGTGNQYKKPEEDHNQHSSESNSKRCRFCGKELEEDSIFCPYCGKNQPSHNAADNRNPEVHFRSFSFGGAPIQQIDPYGGIDKNSEIDGVKVKDIAKFIAFAPNKLLPKFKQIHNGKKTFWNWMAFICPYTHTLFRKMNFHTIMYVLLELISCVLITPLYHSLAYMDLPISSTANQIWSQFISNPLKYASIESIILAISGVLLFFGYRIFAGLYNDSMYKSHTISTIKKIREASVSDEEYEFHKKGGVRPFISLAVLLLIFYNGYYIPALLAGLFFG